MKIISPQNHWLRTVPIAHRGLHNTQLPENSIPSFIAAMDNGYAIEIDIHLCADGHIVVFHDADTLRMTGEEGAVSKLTLAEIKKMRLLSPRLGQAEKLSGQQSKSDFEIPALAEVFDIINGQVPLLIELKNHNKKVGALEERLCKLLDGYTGEVAVQSFNPYSLEYIRRIRPHILRGQLSQNFKAEKMPFYKKFILGRFLLNRKSKPDFISYRIEDFPNKKVSAFKTKGLPVLAWTIMTSQDLLKAKNYCDNVVFENIVP